ncbi:MAG: HEAT repeat domain-containing protein [Armatimonadetes bacterium]|nr:MAG: HEAT repeat domain-containing protein [Armatimonadota bacterium]
MFKALGAIGDYAAIQPHIQALGDKDWHVRWAAQRALRRLGAQVMVTLCDYGSDRGRRLAQPSALIGIKSLPPAPTRSTR